jgi:hypothetical protein
MRACCSSDRVSNPPSPLPPHSDYVQISKKKHQRWGYTRVEASATRLAFEAVSDADGKPLDGFALRKPEGWGAAFMAARGGGGGGGLERR